LLTGINLEQQRVAKKTGAASSIPASFQHHQITLSGFGQGCPCFWSLDAPIVPFDLLFSLDPHYYLHLCLVSPDCI
jgi:hypothetical protein